MLSNYEIQSEWLKNAITLERLTKNIKTSNGNHHTGTDAEACAYLNTAAGVSNEQLRFVFIVSNY